MTAEAPKFTLVCNSESVDLSQSLIVDNFNLFSRNRELLNRGQYVVKSDVPREEFADFISYVQGKSIIITQYNYSSLLLLSREFLFLRLQSECDDFLSRESPSHSSAVLPLCQIHSRLLAIEDRFSTLQNILDAEQKYRRGQELIYGEHGFEKSRSLGLSLLKESADQNHSHSCYIYSKHLSEGLLCDRNVGERAKYLERSAALGNSFGETDFGHCLQEGNVVEKDVARGLEYLRRSANAGNPLGQSWFGYALQHGRGVETNLDEAVRYCRLAVLQGSALGESVYGGALRDGSGVEKDVVEAVKYFKMSADQGNSDGQNSYGCCLRDGSGVEKNLVEAAKYFKMSADQGNVSGQLHYGRALRDGIGVEKNSIEAERYLGMARAKGMI
jgi:TPR repeat protein